jgi:hypothetical protein
MQVEQLNILCSDLQNIDTVSLHTDDPGNTGDNESEYTRETLTWSTPSVGAMKALATFDNVQGNITHIGLWDGEVFKHGRILNVNLPSPQTLKVLVEYAVRFVS